MQAPTIQRALLLSDDKVPTTTTNGAGEAPGKATSKSAQGHAALGSKPEAGNSSSGAWSTSDDNQGFFGAGGSDGEQEFPAGS